MEEFGMNLKIRDLIHKHLATLLLKVAEIVYKDVNFDLRTEAESLVRKLLNVSY
jgi:hypothetical protein